MESALQWFAIVIEFAGLALIALELYLPRSAHRVAEALEGREAVQADTERPEFSPLIVSYIAVWVLGGLVVALWEPELSLVYNAGMTVLSVMVLGCAFAVSKLVRVGVVLGRGNSVGGVGLVLA